MRSLLPLLLVLAITIAGCGDSSSPGSDSDTPKADATTAPGELSEHDAKVVANVDEDVNDWNNRVGPDRARCPRPRPFGRP